MCNHAIARALIIKPKLKIAAGTLAEKGVLRAMYLPSYSAYDAAGFEPARKQLQRLCNDVDHDFWHCDVPLVNHGAVQWNRVVGHNQITNVYLLALDVQHGGALATLDHRVALSTVQGAEKKHLVLL